MVRYEDATAEGEEQVQVERSLRDRRKEGARRTHTVKDRDPSGGPAQDGEESDSV